jgi:phosphoadenosine phosphosulfate reductase
MAVSAADIAVLATEYAARTPQDVIALAFERYTEVALSFSGAEDVVLIDMATKLAPGRVKVFSLDTGRLHAETYRFMDKVRDRYGVAIDVLFPDANAVERLVRTKGLFSFYKDGHNECCGIRKVMPLRKKLATLDAWITGQRKDQSPSTRSDVPVIQLDTAFSTPGPDGRQVIKLNPLANWKSADVWRYIRDYEVPYNELHERGFVSIGCEPCTRAVLPGQHEREGRWWWEEETIKECGLHATNKASR